MSVSAGPYAAPPAAGPSTTEICGTRPEARVIAAKTCPTACSAGHALGQPGAAGVPEADDRHALARWPRRRRVDDRARSPSVPIAPPCTRRVGGERHRRRRRRPCRRAASTPLSSSAVSSSQRARRRTAPPAGPPGRGRWSHGTARCGCPVVTRVSSPVPDEPSVPGRLATWAVTGARQAREDQRHVVAAEAERVVQRRHRLGAALAAAAAARWRRRPARRRRGRRG